RDFHVTGVQTCALPILPGLGVPAELYRDMPLYLRALRDMARAPIDRVRVDSRLTWQQMQEFAAKYAPQLVELIELYSGDRPLLEFGIASCRRSEKFLAA